MLPADFSEDRMGTRAIPSHFNDENREEMKIYVDISECTFVMDFENGGDTLASRYDAEGKWKLLKSVVFLDRERSPSLTRAFYIPFLNANWNAFGNLVLYQNGNIPS